MNKSQAFLSLLMLIGQGAFAQDLAISQDTLRKYNFDPKQLNELVLNDYLIPAQNQTFYCLNTLKINQEMEKPEFAELKNFIEWIKSITTEDVELNLKKPCEMTPASQDIRST